jgi:hypothetical protein
MRAEGEDKWPRVSYLQHDEIILIFLRHIVKHQLQQRQRE